LRKGAIKAAAGYRMMMTTGRRVSDKLIDLLSTTLDSSQAERHDHHHHQQQQQQQQGYCSAVPRIFPARMLCIRD